MDKRVKILAVVGVGLGLLLVVALIWSLSGPSAAPKCKLVEESNIEGSGYQSVASNDLSALARFSGYIGFPDADGGDWKLPFDLRRLTVNPNNPNELTLATDCATFVFKLNRDEQSTTVMRIQLTFDPNLCPGPVKRGSCTARSYIKVPQGKHYQCFRIQALDCNDPDKFNRVVDIVVGKLEFELDKDSDSARKGIYSLPAQVCKA